MSLNRIDHYLIDLQDMYLINTDNGAVWRFDFSGMIARKITAQSKAASAIRYDEEQDKMLIWSNRRWQPIIEGQKAIMYMFNHRIESTLLQE